MKKTMYFLIIAMSFSANALLAKVDSQWRGVERDGKYFGEKLLKKWPEQGPTLVTSIDHLGKGYSQPAVTDDRIYITGMDEGEGFLFSYDLSGKQLWKTVYGQEWAENYPGARVTPTVVGDKIYLISAYGVVICFDKGGTKIWSLDMKKEFNAPNIRWGFTESPLVDGELLFCTPGSADESVVALNRHTGEIVKKIKVNGQASTYCSPHIIKHNGRRILVSMLANSVFGVDMKTFEPLFEAEHHTKYPINPNTPLYHNGFLYVVSGYGTGGQLFEMNPEGTKLTKVWANAELDSQMGATILLDGYLYGSGHKNRNWKCVEFKTGTVKFDSRELGRKGNIIFSDGMLYLYGEKGDIALVKPNPEKLEIISSFKLTVGDGEHWAHPVIKNGKLYVRHGNILNVYDIAR